MGMSESHDGEAGDATHTGQEYGRTSDLSVASFPVHIGRNPSLDEPSGPSTVPPRRTPEGRSTSRTPSSSTSHHRASQRHESQHCKDLATQHELTLDALENDLRSTMEAELETMERDALAAEEARVRQELDLRLERQIQAMHEQHGVEQHQRLEERKAEMKASIERQLHEEYERRLAIQKERLKLDYNQELQARLRDVEANLEQEMEERFIEMENLEIGRLEEGHEALLAEREDQLRRGIRTVGTTTSTAPQAARSTSEG